MNQLIITTLQERRINRDNRFEPLTGNASRERDGVLFGNAHIKISRRKPALELNQTRTFPHRRRDRNQTRIRLGLVTQPLAEDLGEGGPRRGTRFPQANRRVKTTRPMIGNRIGLGTLVARTLSGHHMQKLRPAQFA